jgi:hypothetical protein
MLEAENAELLKSFIEEYAENEQNLKLVCNIQFFLSVLRLQFISLRLGMQK